MKVVSNNIEVNKCKSVMTALMNLIKDKKTSTTEKKKYYKEYLELSANFLIMSR